MFSTLAREYLILSDKWGKKCLRTYIEFYGLNPWFMYAIYVYVVFDVPRRAREGGKLESFYSSIVYFDVDVEKQKCVVCSYYYEPITVFKA